MIAIKRWKTTPTVGGTTGEIIVYADDRTWAITFMCDGKRRTTLHFHNMEDMLETVKAIKNCWIVA
jgi:hypothetical protein